MIPKALPPTLWLPPKPAIIRAAPVEKRANFMPGWFPGGAFAGPAPDPTLTFLNTATSTTDQTSFTFNVDIGTAHAKRRVFVAVHGGVSGTTAVDPASVTINGVSASGPHVNAIDQLRGVTIWSAIVPTGGAGVDIVVTWTSQTQTRCAIGFWAAYNLRDSSPLDTDTLTEVEGANNLSLATEENCIIIAVASIGDATPGAMTFSNAVSERYDAALETTLRYGGGDASAFAGSNPATATITLGTSTDEVSVALSWR